VGYIFSKYKTIFCHFVLFFVVFWQFFYVQFSALLNGLIVWLTFHVQYFPDPPGPAKLEYSPKDVVKNSAVTLTCSVEDAGRPTTTAYRWFRDGALVNNVTTSVWTISPVTLRTRANFTCLAYNQGGEGKQATERIDVSGTKAFH